MIDLSVFKNVQFHIEKSDYGNCIDLSSIGEFEDESRFRSFLARIDKGDIGKLIKELEKHVNTD